MCALCAFILASLFFACCLPLPLTFRSALCLFTSPIALAGSSLLLPAWPALFIGYQSVGGERWMEGGQSRQHGLRANRQSGRQGGREPIRHTAREVGCWLQSRGADPPQASPPALHR